MGQAVVGSEAVASELVSRGHLRWNYRAIFPDVYIPKDAEPTMVDLARAAFLWSKRRGIITGRAAAALHGAEWIDPTHPVELLCANNRPPRGIITRRDRVGTDEVVVLAGIPVASPARTAFDLGRHLPRTQALAHLDALSRATGITAAHVWPLALRYKGIRNICQFRRVIDLMDPGAQSPKESWLRLLLIDAGYPRPTTQIPVCNDWGEPFAYLDMGWEGPLIAVEYDGDEHRKDRSRYVWDERRLREVRRRGWLHVKVIAEDRPADILARVAEAWAQRESEGVVVKQPA